MRFSVVLNAKAGSLVRSSPQRAAARVRERFARTGAEADVVATTGADIGKAVDRALQADTDAIVIGGGDGTVTSSARQVLASGKPLGVLPLGTFNLFARDLGMPLELDAAIDAAVRAEVRSVDVGEVNGAVFLSNSVIGMMPLLVRVREKLRGDSALQRAWGMGVTGLRMLVRYPRLSVEVDLGDGPREIAARSLAVTVNPYEADFPSLPFRKTLDAGCLALYVARHRSRLSFAWLVASLMVGTWRQSGRMDEMLSPELTIHTRSPSIRIVNDGELHTARPPLRYRIRSRALRVLAPRPGDRRE